MTDFIAGNTAVENTRALAESALPTAPTRPHLRREYRGEPDGRFLLERLMRIHECSVGGDAMPRRWQEFWRKFRIEEREASEASDEANASNQGVRPR